MGEDRQDAHSTPPGRKLTVSEAADALSISAEAVRSRLKRGTLRSVKEGDHVYVLLSPDQAATEHRPGADRTLDQSEIIDVLRDQLAYMREQLQEEREARRRADAILAQLANANAEQARTIRELEPAREQREPSRARESPESPGPSETPTDAGGEAQEPSERPWWRFW